MDAATIRAIRNHIKAYKGCMVHLHAIGDRGRVLNAQGVLDGVYDNLFTVLVSNESFSKRYSYTYREILTKHVSILPIAL